MHTSKFKKAKVPTSHRKDRENEARAPECGAEQKEEANKDKVVEK